MVRDILWGDKIWIWECDDAARGSGARWDLLVGGVGGGDGLSSVSVWDRDGHCAAVFLLWL